MLVINIRVEIDSPVSTKSTVDFDENEIGIDESGSGGAFGGITLDTGRDPITEPKAPSLDHSLSDVSLGSSGDIIDSTTSSDKNKKMFSNESEDKDEDESGRIEVENEDDDENENEMDSPDSPDSKKDDKEDDEDSGSGSSLMTWDEVVEWYYRLCDLTGENRFVFVYLCVCFLFCFFELVWDCDWSVLLLFAVF